MDSARTFSRGRFELIAFSALLLLTAAFGREFSKLTIGFSWLHPTEVLLLLVLVAAVARLGPRAAVARIRATGAVLPLVVLWVFGAIAALRGLVDWGFSQVLHDIGLVEYSLVVPIVALLVTNREELLWLVRTLVLAGLLAIVVEAIALWTPLQWDIAGELGLVSVATGMYISIYVAWVISRSAAGADVSWWQYAVAILGVAMVVIGVARAAWVGLLAAFVVALLLAVPTRRAIAWGTIVAVLVLGAALSIPAEKVHFGDPPPSASTTGGDGSTGEGAPVGGDGPSVFGEVSSSFDANAAGGQSVNSQWRLAYWEYMVEESLHNPIGVGFGTPSAFAWSGVQYDRRTGDPNDPFDVTAPHNSFVNILYRTGVLGFVAVLALIGMAAWRLIALARRTGGVERAIAIWLLAVLAVTAGVVSLSVGLENPFLGIFFWTALGLGLVAPRLYPARP
jgi:hypothetical protein